MKTLLWLSVTCIGLVGIIGCSNPSGDVEAAKKAAVEAPKSAEQLPSEMPPQAKAAASAAMGQAQAQQQQANDPARVRAMKEMQKQGSH